MPFRRQPSLQWSQEVPGTRWFKADLHLHTLDDDPGGKAERPPGLNGDAADPGVLRAYARHFLRAAIARDVQVLGLTPHDVRTGPESSAAWTIVDVWNTEEDDDGTPFRGEQVQERLTNALQSGLSQPVRARLGRHHDPKGWVHWVQVDRMRGPEPVRHRGRVYVRRGHSSGEPEASELQELYNVFGTNPRCRTIVTSAGYGSHCGEPPRSLEIRDSPDHRESCPDCGVGKSVSPR